MMSRNLNKGLLILAVLLVGLVAIGAVGAQDTATSGAFLGIRLEDSDSGVTVIQVVNGSPAETAGLQAGDVITALNGEAVENASALVEGVSALAVGDEVALTVTRDGEAVELTATLAERPQGQMFGGRGGRDGRDGRGGMMGNMNLDLAFYDANGWTVMNLSADSALAEAGVQQGDVITALDGEPVAPDALAAFLEGKDTVTLTIDRAGEEQQIDVPASALTELVQFQMGQMPGTNGRMGQVPFDMFHGLMGGQGGRLGLAFSMQENGALVGEVAADSPAAAAGIQADDVITAVNGEAVTEEITLRDRISAYEPGDVVTLDVLRGEETLSLDITLDEQPINMGGMMGRGGRGGMDGMHFFQHPPIDGMGGGAFVPAEPAVQPNL